MKLAYAGSFDPFTNGHLHIIQKALALDPDIFVYVLVANNANKKHHFSVDARVSMIREAARQDGILHRIGVQAAESAHFTANIAKHCGCTAMLRGIRTEQDFQDECGLYHANKLINPKMETIYVMPDINLAAVRSSAVMGMIGPRDWTFAVERLVPSNVMNQICKFHCIRSCHFRDAGVEQGLAKMEAFKVFDTNPYHNWKHLAYCMAELSVHQPCDYDNLGILLHDAVDPDKPDDLITLTSWSRELINAQPHCLRILAATNHSNLPELDKLQSLIHDIDLSVLAWPDERYDEYAKQIEDEYVNHKKVDLFDFRVGRLKFLNNMLKRKTIFLTPYYSDTLARANLERERRGLT